MAISKKHVITRDWLTLFNVGTIRDLTDGQLLERFATGAGEPAELAFAAIVERHGPMVLRVCGATLPDSNDAHDAFQAVFLVLVRKAPGLWVKDSIGPWLHQVACRTVKQMRANAMRRRRLERAAAVSVETTPSESSGDLDRVIHDEINRLPDRYRVAVVLCDLEGRTHEQAARHLGWPIGTVKSRQSRAREKLRDRLARRGVAPIVGIVPATGGPIMPQALVDSTSRIAVQAIAAKTIIPTTSAILAREVLQTMFTIRLIKMASVMLIAAGTIAGAGVASLAIAPGDELQDPVAKKADDGVATIEVKVGREARVISERGSLEAVTREDRLNPVEGTTTISSLKPEGSRVKAGDLILELDSSAFQDRLSQQEPLAKQAFANLGIAEKSLMIAQVRLEEYAQGTFPNARTESESAIKVALTAIELAESRSLRAKQAQIVLDRVIKAKGESVSPQDLIAQLDLSDRIEILRAAIQRENLALAQAQLRLRTLENYTKLRKVTELEAEIEKRNFEVESAQAHYKVEQAKEAKLREKIKRCKLYAESSGMLIYASDFDLIDTKEMRMAGVAPFTPPAIEEGATVRERQKLFSIVDIGGPMRVNTKLHESLVDFVYPGQKTTVKVDALPDRTFEGVVKSVSPVSDATGPSQFGKTTYYTTVVELTTRDKQLRPGMTAEAAIQTDDMLAVPDKATYDVDGTRYVAIKRPDGTFSPRKLNAKYGSASTWFVEVKPDGIQKGDTLAADPTALPQADLQPR